MRTIALDVGDKTIGIALSDELEITANGLKTIERIGIKKDTTAVIDLIRQYGCHKVIIGLPLNLNGTDSIQTEKVREFSRKLSNKLKGQGMTDVGVIFHDERFSTKIAENILIEGDVNRKKRKDVIDKQAAVIILQSYLESMRNK